MSFDFRGLELHGRSIWDHRKIEEALDAIVDLRMNALVLHETDFTTEFLFPTQLFDPRTPWEGAPARRGENALHNNLAYMRYLLAAAARKEVPVWLNVKELSFPDEVIEHNPSLLKDGTVCPTDPFWEGFLEAKYEDLCAQYPAIAGVIVSPGSPEGRAALSQRKCHCDRCSRTGLAEWYRWLVMSTYQPLARHGVKLAVREFSYNRDHQAAIVEALAGCPREIILSVKVTPHDYYPTFPDNTLIGASSRPQWIEYDVMGQYYGWGVFPCLMREDLQARITNARDKGVTGVILRTEWERVNDWWCLESANGLNLTAGARLALGQPVDDAALASEWMERRVRRAPTSGALARFLAGTWEVMKRALYMHDFVFNDSSQFPLSLSRGWWSIAKKHSLSEWFPERAGDLALDSTVVERYIAEKEEAVELLDRLLREFRRDASKAEIDSLPPTLDLFPLYIEGFRTVGECAYLAFWMEQTPVAARDHGARPQLDRAAERVEGYAARARAALGRSAYRHQVAMLIGAERAEAIARDARAVASRS